MNKTLIQYYIVKQHEGFDFIYKCLGRDFSRLNPKKQYLVEISEAGDDPKKIKSKFECMKERLELIQIQESINYTPDEFEALAKEEFELIEWLKDNQPEDWQICTVKNTEKGDKIRFKGNPNLRLVEHVYESKDGIVLYNFETNISYPITNLSKYEINLAEKE